MNFNIDEPGIWSKETGVAEIPKAEFALNPKNKTFHIKTFYSS